jgi:hypothetical protein
MTLHPHVYVSGWRAGFESAIEYLEANWPDHSGLRSYDGPSMAEDMREALTRLGDALEESLCS